MQPFCKDCFYFKELLDPAKLGNQNGACRRYPPQVCMFPTSQGMGTAVTFPQVEARQWCGEWEATTKIETIQ